MKNTIDWQIGSETGFPMKFSARGFFDNNFVKAMFYLSTAMLMISLIFAIVFSAVLIFQSRNQTGVSEIYVTFSVITIAIGLISLHHFYKIIRDNRNYTKDVTIDTDVVTYCENTREKKTEWQEKLKKYSAVGLRHFKHKKQIYWGIYLLHSDKAKTLTVFLPSPENVNAPESDKREFLARMGTKFGLATNYEKFIEKEDEA